MELIHHGSVKDIFRLDECTLAFRFTNRFSVFDCGAHPQEIPGKAEAVCSAALTSFMIAQKVGVPTHFLEQMDDVTLRVQELGIIADRPLKNTEENYVVPLEWITRFAVAGSLLRDLQNGAESPAKYGFHHHDVPSEGTPLRWPVHQLTTKFEKVDRKLSEGEAMDLAGIGYNDIIQFRSMIDRLDGALALAFHRAGFAHFDGKKECGLGFNREKMIVDVFGTPDEDRPVLLVALAKGEVEHYGKEFLRKHFIEMGFYGQVKKAREEGRPDPPYPSLPEEIIAEAARRYDTFALNYWA